MIVYPSTVPAMPRLSRAGDRHWLLSLGCSRVASKDTVEPVPEMIPIWESHKNGTAATLETVRTKTGNSGRNSTFPTGALGVTTHFPALLGVSEPALV